MVKLLRKKKKSVKEPIDNFIEDLKKHGIDIKIQDRKEILKNCGRGYLKLFRSPLIEAKWNRFLFIFRNKERKAWYSEYLDRVVVNLAYSPDQELQKTVADARKFREIEIGVEEIKNN